MGVCGGGWRISMRREDHVLVVLRPKISSYDFPELASIPRALPMPTLNHSWTYVAMRRTRASKGECGKLRVSRKRHWWSAVCFDTVGATKQLQHTRASPCLTRAFRGAASLRVREEVASLSDICLSVVTATCKRRRSLLGLHDDPVTLAAPRPLGRR